MVVAAEAVDRQLLFINRPDAIPTVVRSFAVDVSSFSSFAGSDAASLDDVAFGRRWGGIIFC